MQTETPRTFDTLLFETALQAAATAEGLPASCRRRSCRDSGRCALRYQPWNGENDRGCSPDFAIARRAAEHVEFLRLLAWIDPEGSVYDGIARPYLEVDPKLGPRPARIPEAWAKAIAAAFAIPARLNPPPCGGEQPVRGTRIRHAGGMAKGQRTPGRCEAAGTRPASGGEAAGWGSSRSAQRSKA